MDLSRFTSKMNCPFREIQYDVCKQCLGIDYVKDTKSADIICTRCGTVCGKWSPEYCDGPPDPDSVYVRKVYFKNVLRAALGMDGPCVPHALLHRLRVHLGVRALHATANDVRALMRKLRITGMFKAVPQIVHALRDDGTPFPTLTHVEKDSLGKMFDVVQEIFFQFRTRGRKNLISYHYLLEKLLKLIRRYDDFAPYLGVIRTPSKQRFADAMWEKVSAEARWSLRPTQHAIPIHLYEPVYRKPNKRPKPESKVTKASETAEGTPTDRRDRLRGSPPRIP